MPDHDPCTLQNTRTNGIDMEVRGVAPRMVAMAMVGLCGTLAMASLLAWLTLGRGGWQHIVWDGSYPNGRTEPLPFLPPPQSNPPLMLHLMPACSNPGPLQYYVAYLMPSSL
jgi:hypothetical protein